jgi:dipeptidyl aminopeptidase/acylaminoacyl peptidase
MRLLESVHPCNLLLMIFSPRLISPRLISPRATLAAILLAAAPLLCTPQLHAQSGTPDTMAPMPNPDPRLAEIHARMTRAAAPGNVAISPDGTLIAYTLSSSQGVTLHLLPYPSADPAQDKIVSIAGAADCSSYAPVWAPDSQTLAFTSDCTAKAEKPPAQAAGLTQTSSAQPDQIFLYSRATGSSRQLTHLTGLFDNAAFSPDGKSLAFLFVENATRSAGALAAMKPWSGVIGEDGIEVQRVGAIEIQSGDFRFITPPNLHVYEFSWSPTSHGIAFVAANPPGENNWWVAKLYEMNVGAGSAESARIKSDYKKSLPPGTGGDTSVGDVGSPTVVFDPNTTKTALHGLQIAVPRFSPDGKQIAFIGGLMSDQGSTGGDIWVVPSSGGSPVDITPNIDGTPSFLSWTGDNTIGFVEDRRGHTLLTDYTVSTRTQDAQNDLGEVSVGGGPIKDAISISTHGVLAFSEQGHATPPEVYAGPFTAPRPITHLNPNATPPARTESIVWTNQGFHVQGWLTYPADYNPARKYPLIVTVHGGPSASAGARWGGSVWAQLGYFVFAPNPRGSFGEGEAFTAANVKDFGYGDLRDILAGMDAIEKKVSIDKSREGLMGWSYGGFMTMFAVTQTHRFKAAVAGAGISDWKSYYGENSIDQWMVPFFGATVYDDPAVYARSSAIEFIKNVTTPTLVVVGDRDGECPAPQSFEFWHALRAEHVKTQLVVFPNEGHGFRNPAHIRDLEAREVAWFAQNMPAR